MMAVTRCMPLDIIITTLLLLTLFQGQSRHITRGLWKVKHSKITHIWAVLSEEHDSALWTWAWLIPYMDNQVKNPPKDRDQNVCRFSGLRSKL